MIAQEARVARRQERPACARPTWPARTSRRSTRCCSGSSTISRRRSTRSTREALQLEQRAIEYNRLKRNYDRLAKLSEQVGGRERETSLAGHLKTNNVRLLDAALVPTAAIAPERAARGRHRRSPWRCCSRFGLAFLLEMLDSTVKAQDDIERKRRRCRSSG